MLALARGEGQSIIIDGHIEVKIVKWSRSSVRLAIQAPREITVDRDEIWRKMHPGELTPLEKAEKERKERFAREAAAGGRPREGHPADPDAAPPATPNAAAETTIKAPAAGIFYDSAGPGGAPFIAPGSVLETSTLIGSLRTTQDGTGNTIDLHAGVRGTVLRILVTNGQAVAAEQVLVTVKPPAM
jgi:carbon storage regulator